MLNIGISVRVYNFCIFNLFRHRYAAFFFAPLPFSVHKFMEYVKSTHEFMGGPYVAQDCNKFSAKMKGEISTFAIPVFFSVVSANTEYALDIRYRNCITTTRPNQHADDFSVYYRNEISQLLD